MVNLRKLLFISSNVLLVSSYPKVSAMMAISVLWSSLVLQNFVKPYHSDSLNYIDYVATFTSVVTLYGGLFFMGTEVSEGLRTVLFVFVLLFNIYFWVIWLFSFMNIMRARMLAMLEKRRCPFMRSYFLNKEMLERRDKLKADKLEQLERLRLRPERPKSKRGLMLAMAKDYVRGNSTGIGSNTNLISGLDIDTEMKETTLRTPKGNKLTAHTFDNLQAKNKMKRKRTSKIQKEIEQEANKVARRRADDTAMSSEEEIFDKQSNVVALPPIHINVRPNLGIAAKKTVRAGENEATITVRAPFITPPPLPQGPSESFDKNPLNDESNEQMINQDPDIEAQGDSFLYTNLDCMSMNSFLGPTPMDNTTTARKPTQFGQPDKDDYPQRK